MWASCQETPPANAECCWPTDTLRGRVLLMCISCTALVASPVAGLHGGPVNPFHKHYSPRTQLCACSSSFLPVAGLHGGPRSPDHHLRPAVGGDGHVTCTAVDALTIVSEAQHAKVRSLAAVGGDNHVACT